VFVVEVDDEDDGEGEGDGCSEVAGGVFCEVGGGIEVGGVLVGGGDDGGGGEEEVGGGGGNDEESWKLVAGAEDESGASWDGADTRDAKMSQPPPPSYHAMSNSHASSHQKYSSRLYFIIKLHLLED